jgi:predicted DNA binding protein
MPGPKSDAFDPEFRTRANAEDVRNAIRNVDRLLGMRIRPEKTSIVEVVHGNSGCQHVVELTDLEMRVIRFALARALEDI